MVVGTVTNLIIRGQFDAGQAFAEVNKSFGELEDKSKQTGGVVGSVLGDIGKFFTGPAGITAAAVGAAGSFGAYTASVIDNTRELQVAANRTGFTASQMQLLRNAAVGVGEDIGTAEGLVETFNERIQESIEGTGQGFEVFKALGISVRDNNGTMKSSQQILSEYAKRVNGMSNQTEAAAFNTRLLGGDGFKLISTLSGMEDQLTTTNSQFDGQAKAAEEAAKEWRQIKLDVAEFGAGAVRPLIPLVVDALRWLRETARVVGERLQPVWEKLNDGFKAAQPILAEVTRIWGAVMGPILQNLGNLVRDVVVKNFNRLREIFNLIFPQGADFQGFANTVLGALTSLGEGLLRVNGFFTKLGSLITNVTTFNFSSITSDLDEITKKVEADVAALKSTNTELISAEENTKKIKENVGGISDDSGDVRDDWINVAGSVGKVNTAAQGLADALSKIDSEETRNQITSLTRHAEETDAAYYRRRLALAKEFYVKEQQEYNEAITGREGLLNAFYSLEQGNNQQIARDRTKLNFGVYTEERKNLERLVNASKAEEEAKAKRFLDQIDELAAWQLQRERSVVFDVINLRTQADMKERERIARLDEERYDALIKEETRLANEAIAEAKRVEEERRKEQERTTAKLKEDLTDSIQGLITGTKTFGDILNDIRQGVIQKIIRDISGRIADGLIDAVSGGKKAFEDLANSLPNIFGGFFKFLGNAFSGVFNFARNAISGIIGKVVGGAAGAAAGGAGAAAAGGGAGLAVGNLGIGSGAAAIGAGAAGGGGAGSSGGAAAAAGGGAAAAGSGAGAGILGVVAGTALVSLPFILGNLLRSKDRDVDKLREATVGVANANLATKELDEGAVQLARLALSTDRIRRERKVDTPGDERRFEERNEQLENPRAKVEFALSSNFLRGLNPIGKNLVASALYRNLEKFQDGGVVQRRPGGILANIGEGRYNEAVVPLPNGRAIPVEIRGDRGRQEARINNINVTINVSQDGERVEGQSDPERDAERLKDFFVEVAREQLRPGGVLAAS